MISVAIDGPAGAGKSTLARRLAADFGYIYVDTGAMFRTIGLYALRAGKEPKDNEAVDALLPNATVKIFLTASPEARATRRWKEYQQKGIDTPYEDVLADVKQRDYQDTHRAAAPLKQADDAVLLDTSELNFEQSFEAMKKIITEKVR